MGLTEDADLIAHLKECASCRARGETMQSLVHQLTAAHAKLDCGHEEARKSLMAILPASRPLESARTWNPITQRIGGITMRQRIALCGVGVVAVLGLLLLWGGIVTKPLSAMEQMAENIRKAKSFKAVITMEGPFTSEAGKPPITQKTTGTLYWLAPKSTCWDFKHTFIPKPKEGIYPPEDETIIFVGKNKMITIDHKEKKFYRQEARTLYRRGLEGEIVEKLGDFSGQADRELGAKDIGGKKASGFEIDLKKLFKPSDGYGPLKGMAEIWIDTESSLPVIVQFKSNTNQAITENAGMTQIEDFQWNINLDPKLFKPPEGYKDDEPTVEWRFQRYTEILRLYAEWTGGHYPQGSKDGIEADSAYRELLKKFGFEYPSDKVPQELVRNEQFKKVQWVYGGLAQIASFIKFTNEDAAYYGKTVGPNDKDKVLLRWKLDDGQYAAIYGDLHWETISAEQLRALEGK